MYKVLIVEDELLVRTGIRASIEWDKFNMCVVNEAANGQIAWDLYQEALPDLVLTDIKMPFMNGIELIRNIRSTENNTKVIILSCLEDFSLAQEAIRLGVSGYILKLTMTPEEMEDVLLHVKNELDAESNSRNSSAAHGNIYDILENSLLGYLAYNIPALPVCLETLAANKLTLYPHDLVVAMMEIEQYEHLQDIYRDRQGRLIDFSIQNIMNEVLARSNSGLVVHESTSRYLIVFHSLKSTGSFQHVMDVLDEIITILKNYFNVTPRFYLSAMEQGHSHLQDLYRQCLTLSAQSFFMYNGSVNRYSSSWKDSLRQTLLSRSRKLLLSINDSSFTSEFILKPLEKILEKDFSVKEVRNLFYNSFIAYIHNYKLKEEESFRWVSDFLQALSSCSGYYEMLHQFISSAGKLEQYAAERTVCSREIVQTLQYLQNNYQHPVTLNEVANLVGLSPNYFSSMFKKELGSSFLDYLNRYRIEKSMELLQNTSLKTYEIAFHCGFSDNGYFGKTFKKYTGKTPNEYKKSCVLPYNERRG